ncbi:MAG TPA: hypothetical protein VJ001_09615, partial [Rhodocyclaceae bacterium]|nr:hypothetical protein [Rhodocyclaceae bacterium]
FDAANGKFVGRPPAGEQAAMSIRMVARDADGREAVVVFQINLAEGATQSSPPSDETTAPNDKPSAPTAEPRSALDDPNPNGKRSLVGRQLPTGRASLSEQIRLASRQSASFARLTPPPRTL